MPSMSPLNPDTGDHEAEESPEGGSAVMATATDESRGTTPGGGELLTRAEWTRVIRILGLTAREAEIVRAVLADRKDEAIADDLGIRPSTVHTHLERVYHKLNVHGRVGLVLRVVRAHLRR